MTGKVYLVGAGPGDPGLITVKGMQALQEAQVVVYDRLVDPAQLKAVPQNAELIFVGKARGRQQLTQPKINQLLVDKASQGLNVVRLKGGDPFVFGRGGEEALALKANGLPYEIVPGVTSAIAALAYAGIPITHRGVSTTFTVVSGSEDPSKPESTIPWDVLAKNGGTLVVLMGWKSLENILDTLEKNGMSHTTPAALVQWGTWSDQKTVTGNIKNILKLGTDAGLTAPVITVIGEVVKLREDLSWFDKRPLFGKRVLNTRSRSQASQLQTLLEQAGANPLELPTIEIGPLFDFTELDATLERLADYKWVIFASA
ncbi:MAG: uroporphyrinogen-III C-methyltransferase, partial [SAR202 cluster bacterium]